MNGGETVTCNLRGVMETDEIFRSCQKGALLHYGIDYQAGLGSGIIHLRLFFLSLSV